jgi:hypothetical protein
LIFIIKAIVGNWNAGLNPGALMKKSAIIGLLTVTAIITVVSCKNGEPDETKVFADDIDPNRKIVEGFTFDNYPLVDGSTSAEPLNILLACKLLGIDYQWENEINGWKIEPVIRNVVNSMNFWKLIRTSQTLSNNSYPLAAEVYAIIRSDLDESSMAYKLYELLQTEKGKQVIKESGYVPN